MISMIRPGVRQSLLLVAAIVAATALPLAAPQLTRIFVDDAVAGAPLGTLVAVALGYLGLALAGQGARLCLAWLAARLAWDGTNRLRERLAQHALGLDLAFHRQRTPGEMIERVDGDVAAIADFVVAFLLDIVASLLLLAGVIVVVAGVDWRLGAALLGYCLVAGYGMARAQRLAVPSATRARQSNADLLGLLEERLAGVEDLRANGAGEHTVRRFVEVSARWYRGEFVGSRVGSGLIGATGAVFATGTALLLGVAAWLGQAGLLTVGTAVLIFQYTQLVRTPFERLIERLREYQAAMAGFARVRELLDTRPALPVVASPVELPSPGALGLRLDCVDFAYPGGNLTLSGIDLELAPGEKLGLVGRTGSGKTTIARLVLRLYDPTAGAVRAGGVDLRAADPDSVRRRIGVVTQDVQLFTGSVRDNLTLFREHAADDAVLRDILTQLGLGDWDLDADVHAVSAGEAQLLALARAFLSDPGLVVLDEASSRLDPATEQRVEAAVDRLLTGRTAVVIAHRLSVLSRVDKVAVVDRGKIVEYGSRAALAADPHSQFARLLELSGVGR